MLGGGESGVGAALLAKKKGLEVFVSDYGAIADKYKKELDINSIPFEEKGHSIEKIETTELIVKSPGIPDTSEILTKLRLRHKEIISEIEFAYRYYDGKIIAITGSNGKTTTTSWIYHVLSQSDMRVGLGGNIGHSFARILSTEKLFDWMVLELSSFQLDNVQSFSAEIATILNITPDHLDRYDHTMYKYAFAKWQLAMHTKESGHLITNADDAWTALMNIAFPVQCQVLEIPFATSSDSSKDEFEKFDIKKNIQLKGRHNVFNAKVALKICMLAGMSEEDALAGLNSFQAIEHRLESVAVINGVEFINDSKATNIDSVMVALEAMPGNVVWVAGGTDKGNDYSMLAALVEEKVKSIICLTKDDSKLRKAFAGTVNVISTTDNVDECIKMAMQQADEGDVVLLSPACASFDLFNNYEHRGKAFKESIRKYSIGQNS